MRKKSTTKNRNHTESKSSNQKRANDKQANGIQVRKHTRTRKASGNQTNPKHSISDRLLPVKEGQIAEAEIVGLGEHGQGVGKVDGFTLFIPDGLPGERVRVKVTKVKKQYGFAELLDVLEASPDRIDPPCSIFESCGGCQLQHLSGEAQLRWKRQMIVDQLERIGKLNVIEGTNRTNEGSNPSLPGSSSELPQVLSDASSNGNPTVADVNLSELSSSASENSSRPLEAGKETYGVVVHPTIGMDDSWRYRNKAQVPIGKQDGKLVGGFYSRGSHDIVDMDACLIQHDANDQAVRWVKQIATDLGVTAYDERTHTGWLRHVVVKNAFQTGEVMVVLVTNGEEVPHEDVWIERIRRDIPNVKSICQNVNTKRTNVIFGPETKVLWGRDVIYDELDGIRFAISARSFYQVNPVQTEVLYGKALEYAGLTGNETVIDSYCGIGTISLFLAQQAKQVYGIEVVPEAIADAKENARLNGIDHVEFTVGQAEKVLPAWKQQGITADVIVVDPPRKGCDSKLIRTLIEMQPKRVVYVSCNPSTLARDLRLLEDGGFRTVEVQPVDMFPHTTHVECVVRIVRED